MNRREFLKTGLEGIFNKGISRVRNRVLPYVMSFAMATAPILAETLENRVEKEEKAEKYSLKLDKRENSAGELVWKFQTGPITISSPAIDDEGTIYVGSTDHNLYAINSDGILKWTFPTGDEIHSSPAIDEDGTIFFGSNDNHLYAVNPDGTEKWRFETGDDVISSPAINDGMIFVGSNDRNLFAIDTQGNLRWKYETDDEKRENILVDERMQSWKGFDHNGAIRSSPSIGIDGAIHIGAMDEHLYSLSTSGTLNWRRKVDFKQSFDNQMGWDITTKLTNGFIFSSPAIDDGGTIYVGTDNNDLYAFESNGNAKWKIHFSDSAAGNEFSSPAIGNDGTIYIGSVDGNLYAVNPDGTIKWNFPTGDRIDSSPLISNQNTIFCGSDDGFLYAIGQDGNLLWKFQTDSSINSSPNINKGILFFGSEDGHFYAIDTGTNARLADTPWPMFGFNSSHERMSKILGYSINGNILFGDEGLADVLITISGENIPDKDVFSNQDGEFSFKGLFNGEYLLIPYKWGHVFNPSSLEMIVNNDNVSIDSFISSLYVDQYGELLTHTRKSKSQLDISPDGKWIAYVEEGNIWIVSNAELDLKNITEDIDYDCYAPCFKSNSKEITFSYTYNNPSWWGYIFTSIHKVNLETLEMDGISGSEGSFGLMEWSPNGKYSVSVHYMSNAHISINDLINHVSYNNEYLYHTADFSFSPDNSHMVTTFARSGHLSRIFIPSWETEKIETLGGSHPDYSPDGKWIMYATNNLYVYKVETEENFPVFEDPMYNAPGGVFSPDGRKIYYLHPINGATEIFVADFPFYEDITTIVEEKPTKFFLQNYPNPFNNITTIKYNLPKESNVILDVYNISGQKVKSLIDKIQEPGQYEVSFNANNLSSGIYFYKLRTPVFSKIEKMMLVK